MGGEPGFAYNCRNFPGGEASIKLYCLVTEAHVREQLAQGHYLAVHRARFDNRVTSSTHYRYNIKPHSRDNNAESKK